MKWKGKVIWSVIIVVLWIVAASFYHAAAGPIESSIAVEQLNGGAAEYTVGRAVAEGKIIKSIHIMGWLLLGVTWVPGFIKYIRS